MWRILNQLSMWILMELLRWLLSRLISSYLCTWADFDRVVLELLMHGLFVTASSWTLVYR